ncbi:MAG: flagellar hook-basal body complex protein FliE [Clostridiales bacterium]|nr:flagellar hook-basal body complex protein FliE [Clostridiales bacterium]
MAGILPQFPILPSQPGSAGGVGMPREKKGAGEAFLEELKSALSEVDRYQKEALMAGEALSRGDLQDVAQAMVAAQKAQLALSLTVEVRNRAIEAYQEIMRMQV